MPKPVPELPTLLNVPRGQARTEVRALIGEGQALLRRRRPVNLRSPEAAASELAGHFRRWATSSNDMVTRVFGSFLAESFRKRRMTYTTLDAAQDALRVRLKLLEAYETALPGLRKSQAAKESTSETAQRQPRKRRLYDFCLSFAGEDRVFVDRFVAEMHRVAPTVKLFYDRERKAELLGSDLFDVLGDVYEHQARHSHHVRLRPLCPQEVDPARTAVHYC